MQIIQQIWTSILFGASAYKTDTLNLHIFCDLKLFHIQVVLSLSLSLTYTHAHMDKQTDIHIYFFHFYIKYIIKIHIFNYVNVVDPE